MSSKKFLVFVYGTLKRGEPNHFVLDPNTHNNVQTGVSQFICKAETSKKYPLVIGTRYNIPFLLDKANSGHFVKGEVYEVDKTVMDNLDKLEGYPGHYDRELQDFVSLEDSNTVQAWVYIIRKFSDTLLNREWLMEYKNSSSREYIERARRNSNIAAKDDLSYEN